MTQSRPEKSLLAERKRLEDRLYRLDIQRDGVNAALERVDAALDALKSGGDNSPVVRAVTD